MTMRLRALVVDDEEDLADTVESSVAYGFKKIGWEVHWTTASTALGAYDVLQQEEPFDFAIVDYGLDRPNTGVGVVAELRERAPDCYILVVTSKGNDFPYFAERSRRAGADDAIMRSKLTLDAPPAPDPDSWDVHTLARRIRRHLRVRGKAGELNIRFKPNAELHSMLYSLGDPPGRERDATARGERIARALILDWLESDDARATLHVDHLAAGKSGAHMCKVVRDEPGHPLRSFVIKISLNHAALEAERRANEDATGVLGPHVLVEFAGDPKKDGSSGYAALMARLAEDAVTLRSWLMEPGTSAESAKAVADELFKGHLAGLFQQNLRSNRTTVDWLAISPLHRLRIRDAISVYSEVWGHTAGANLSGVETIADHLMQFVGSGDLPGANVPPMDDHVAFVGGFGDLHSENILIRTTGQPRPFLVDASGYGPQHWAGDAARLLVDLVIAVRRSGVEPMLWRSVAADAAYAGLLCDCDEAGAGNTSAVTDALIGQVVTHRETYLQLKDLGLRKAAWHWQWHVALAREFLRQGSRPGLLPPTAVLALTAAATHLDRAATALRSG